MLLDSLVNIKSKRYGDTVDFLQKPIAVVSTLNLELMMNLCRTITLFQRILVHFVDYTSKHRRMLRLN